MQAITYAQQGLAVLGHTDDAEERIRSGLERNEHLELGGAQLWALIRSAELMAAGAAQQADMVGSDRGLNIRAHRKREEAAASAEQIEAGEDAAHAGPTASCSSTSASEASGDDAADRWFHPSSQMERRDALAQLPPVASIDQPGIVHYLTAAQLAAMSAEQFQHDYLYANRPFVAVFPEVHSWPAATLWTDPAILKKRYGTLTFTVADLPYPGLHGSTAATITLAEFIETVMNGDGDVRLATGDDTRDLNATARDHRYIFLALPMAHPMAADILLPHPPLKWFDGTAMVEQDAENKPGDFEIYIGPSLSGAQPHYHEAAWNVLLQGSKRWFIWPRACPHVGYHDQHGVPVWEWVQQQLPKLRGTPCAPLEFEQKVGELVYVPFGWNHAVLNTGPVVGVARQIGTPPLTVVDYRPTHIPPPPEAQERKNAPPLAQGKTPV